MQVLLSIALATAASALSAPACGGIHKMMLLPNSQQHTHSSDHLKTSLTYWTTSAEWTVDGDAVDAPGGDGKTLLAMTEAHSNTITLLLEAGASDELQESSGNACMIAGPTGAGRTSIKLAGAGEAPCTQSAQLSSKDLDDCVCVEDYVNTMAASSAARAII